MGIHQALFAYTSDALSISSLAFMSSQTEANSYNFNVPITSIGSSDLVVVAAMAEVPNDGSEETACAIEPRLGSVSGSLVSYTEAVGNLSTGGDSQRSRAGIVVINGSNLSGSVLYFEVDLSGSFASFSRIAMRAFRVSGRSSISTFDTQFTTSSSSTSNLSHTISTTTGDVSVTSAYFADGQNHTLSGHDTVFSGVSNEFGSGDFGISSSLTANTTITYTRSGTTNTQGHSMASAVFR